MNDVSSSLQMSGNPLPEVLPGTVFTSIVQCSNATGFHKKLIKTAKNMGAPGFRKNGRIYWDELGPYMKAHKDVVAGGVDESLEYYKTQIAKRDVVLRDLQIQKAKEEMLDPKDVKKFMNELAVILSSVLKKKRQELMSKCTGYEILLDKEFTEIFSLINREVSVWTEK